MTNNHVLPDAQACTNSIVRFDYSQSVNAEDLDGETFRLDPERFFLTSPENELDYTIVAVAEPQGGLHRPWARLIERSGKVLLDQSVNIIQHPSGRRQELITRDSTLTYIGEEPSFAHYSGDTEPGSSGSPCFNDRWELAFLHHASVPDTDATGHYLKKNGQVWKGGDDPADINWVANEGIRISRIVADVRERSLSQQRAALFGECFTDPELSRFIPGGPGRGKTAAARKSASQIREEITPSGQTIRRYPDGRVSYLFEVSFGPHGMASGSPNGATSTDIAMPSDALPPPVVSSRSSAASATALLERSIADMVEQARSSEPYYDEDRDRDDADLYYAAIRYDSGEVRMFQDYSRLVRSTHDRIYGYNSARLSVLYPYVDFHEDGTLRSIYSGHTMRPADVILEEAAILLDGLHQAKESLAVLGIDGLLALADARQSPFELEAADVPYNCEHVVPQSWYDKKSPMVSDLHHLFTCERNCNSYRGNRPYGEFGDYEAGTLDPLEASLRAQCGLVEAGADGRLMFEPERNKGTVARAVLYFLLRYADETLVGDEPGEMPADRVAMLLEWHEAEPAGLYERHRNRAIFLTQGNRNPFIDRPALARKLAFRKGFEE